LLNELYEQIGEILLVGKILYKATNPAKLADYTFTELLKKVRQVVKSNVAAAKAVLKTPEK
jgi:hypothetical protein